VNANAKSLQKTQILRQQAKDISKTLFKIAVAQGYKVDPSADYWGAIGLGTKAAADFAVHRTEARVARPSR
jgi:hypothetical protein